MDKREAPELFLFRRRDAETDPEEIFFRPPVMETRRLRLRMLRMRDAKDLFRWSQDPAVAQYVLWDAHRNLSETRSYLRYIRRLYRMGLPGSWGIELKETGELIGTIGIMAWSPEHRCAEVGYSLGRSWWHQGFAPEALRQLMKLLFETLGAQRIEGMCDVRNPASARVMEKCGMRREGLLRRKIRYKGAQADVLMYAAVAEDWPGEQPPRET